MTLVDITVLVAALLLSALVIWYFFYSSRKAVRAAVAENVQEINIEVKGAYSPDLVVVKAGRPVRINFLRLESSSCSEMVLFPSLEKSAHLPEGVTVPIEFTPPAPGEYPFQCQMGMLQGKVVAE